MQTTYRLKAKEISMTFLKSLKTMFAGQEVEITVRSLEQNSKTLKPKEELLKMIQDNNANAPVVDPAINIHDLINESRDPSK